MSPVCGSKASGADAPLRASDASVGEDVEDGRDRAGAYVDVRGRRGAYRGARGEARVPLVAPDEVRVPGDRGGVRHGVEGVVRLRDAERLGDGPVAERRLVAHEEGRESWCIWGRSPGPCRGCARGACRRRRRARRRTRGARALGGCSTGRSAAAGRCFASRTRCLRGRPSRPASSRGGRRRWGGFRARSRSRRCSWWGR